MQKTAMITVMQMKEKIENRLQEYQNAIMEQLYQAGMEKEEADSYNQEIFERLCSLLENAGVNSMEALEEFAVPVINGELERILFSYYVKKYIGRQTRHIEEKEEQPVKRQKPIMQEKAVQEKAVQEKAVQEKAVQEKAVQEDGQQGEKETPEYLRETRQVRRTVEPNIRNIRINWPLSIVLSIIAIVILWTAVGFLMSNDIIPRVNMGYTLFNEYIWNIF